MFKKLLMEAITVFLEKIKKFSKKQQEKEIGEDLDEIEKALLEFVEKEDPKNDPCLEGDEEE